MDTYSSMSSSKKTKQEANKFQYLGEITRHIYMYTMFFPLVLFFFFKTKSCFERNKDFKLNANET